VRARALEGLARRPRARILRGAVAAGYRHGGTAAGPVGERSRAAWSIPVACATAATTRPRRRARRRRASPSSPSAALCAPPRLRCGAFVFELYGAPVMRCTALMCACHAVRSVGCVAFGPALCRRSVRCRPCHSATAVCVALPSRCHASSAVPCCQHGPTTTATAQRVWMRG
jgi:hypothetical protein